MKRFLLFFSLLAPTITMGQNDEPPKRYTLMDIVPYDKESGAVKYSEVVQVDGATKDQLYERARKWIATTYRSAKDVNQYESKDAGEVIGKGYFDFIFDRGWFSSRPLTAYHIIDIRVKDGRFKYEIEIPHLNNVPLLTGYTNNVTPYQYAYDLNDKNAKKMLSAMNEKTKALISSLTLAMKDSKQNENW